MYRNRLKVCFNRMCKAIWVMHVLGLLATVSVVHGTVLTGSITTVDEGYLPPARFLEVQVSDSFGEYLANVPITSYDDTSITVFQIITSYTGTLSVDVKVHAFDTSGYTGCYGPCAFRQLVGSSDTTVYPDIVLQQGGVIRGTVADSISSKALSGAYIQASQLNGTQVKTVQSQAGGGYSINGLEDGSYVLEAYLDDYWNKSYGIGGAETLTVEAAGTLDSIDWQLNEKLTISGVIRCDSDFPPTAFLVFFNKDRSYYDHHLIGFVGSDSMAYSLKGNFFPAPGRYYVCIRDDFNMINNRFKEQYFNGVQAIDEAELLDFMPGSAIDSTSVDFELIRVSSIHNIQSSHNVPGAACSYFNVYGDILQDINKDLTPRIIIVRKGGSWRKIIRLP